MARGRRAKPTAQKKRDGNPGKRTLNESEPEFPAGIPDPPAVVAADAVAAAEWRRVVPILLTSRVLTEGDLAVLVGYVTQYSLYLAAAKEVAAKGIVLKSDLGVRKNPAVQVQQDAAKQMRGFAAEMGLTPASRTKVSTADAPSKDSKEGKTKEFFQPGAHKLASTRPN